MKKTIKSLFAIAISAFALTACSDVPTPEGYNPEIGDGLVVYAPEGQGIVSSPYNVAGLKEAMKDLAKGSTTTNEVYATGYVAEIDNSEKNAFNPQYGNFTYYITDNEEGKSTKFYVYRGLGLGGDKFADANALKVGDKVTVYGKIQNYNGALQFSQGSKLAVLNDQTATNGGGGNIDPDMGTESKPFDVANAINAGEKTGVYIKGFIVGSAYSNQETKKTEWNLNATNPQASNILLAASASETDYTKCIPVALPSGSDVRTALNLKDNAGNLGKEVLLYGDLTKYFSQQGLKNTSYALLDGKAIGTKPGTTPTVQPSNFEAGQYFFILQVDGTYKEGIPVAATSNYGYITLKDATITEGKLAGTADNIFTFTKEGDGFTIQDASNRYYYMDDSHTSFQVSAEKPSTNYIWSINVGEDGKATITNIGRNKVVDYSTSYKTVSPGSNGGGLPMLLKQGAALDGGTSGGGDTGGGDTGGGDTGGDTGGIGTYSNPYTVTSGIEAEGEGAATKVENIYIKGYIVGWVSGQVLATGASFNAEATVKSNILIAASATETDLANCMPVQLPSGSAVRNGVNLQENAGNYKKEVILYGNLEKYFGVAGVKTVTYAEIGENSFGTKP